MCGLLCLAFFTYNVHPCYSMDQYFIPFYDGIIFHRMDISHFVYPFINRWTLELFPPFGYSAAMNICVQVFV